MDGIERTQAHSNYGILMLLMNIGMEKTLENCLRVLTARLTFDLLGIGRTRRQD